MGFAIGLVLGIGIGWVIAEQPEWARNLADSVKNSIKDRS